MPNDAYEHMKMLLNVNKNAKIVIESELRAIRFLALMNASPRYRWSIQANECVFSRNEQQKVYLKFVEQIMCKCKHVVLIVRASLMSLRKERLFRSVFNSSFKVRL